MLLLLLVRMGILVSERSGRLLTAAASASFFRVIVGTYFAIIASIPMMCIFICAAVWVAVATKASVAAKVVVAGVASILATLLLVPRWRGGRQWRPLSAEGILLRLVVSLTSKGSLRLVPAAPEICAGSSPLWVLLLVLTVR